MTATLLSFMLQLSLKTWIRNITGDFRPRVCGPFFRVGVLTGEPDVFGNSTGRVTLQIVRHTMPPEHIRCFVAMNLPGADYSPSDLCFCDHSVIVDVSCEYDGCENVNTSTYTVCGLSFEITCFFTKHAITAVRSVVHRSSIAVC